ncbi:MAG: sulfatase-like hydrolase/transferase [Cytophagales bacterium]|nr:sulfatase-like hydrolase/transferase [Cytophagales bacterium]
MNRIDRHAGDQRSGFSQLKFRRKLRIMPAARVGYLLNDLTGFIIQNSVRALLLSYCCFLLSCGHEQEQLAENQSIINPSLDFQPNILWLVAEDMSGNIPAFGDSTIVTPTLDRLAAEGVCYDHFFTPAPVCAPARSAIITGMYPNHIGSNHMRTGPWYAGRASEEAIATYRQYLPKGLIPYEATPQDDVKMFTEYLRAAGYYTSNNAKEDYQFVRTHVAWDESSRQAHWRNRKPSQPFFAVFNFGVTHESRIWAKKEDSLWVTNDLDMPVPPYLPDTEIGQQDVRRMYSNILEMDAQIGAVLDQLEADGLLDSTIVMWYTDHGGPLPRQKRSLHDSGIKVPLIVRFPNAIGAGSRDARMTSFIDLGPTALSIAGVTPPDHLDGKAFLGQYLREEEPTHVFAAADRFDASYEQSRAVRDGQYKYIRHYQPEEPMFLQVAYRDQMDIMQELYRLRDQGQFTELQKLWFADSRPEEQLFDVIADPHEVNDLAQLPEYKEKLEELRLVNDQFVSSINDRGLMPEEDLLESIWPSKKQPVTADPTWSIDADQVSLACVTDGASIGYQITNDAGEWPTAWQIYVAPFSIQQEMKIRVIADRIGYRPSKAVDISFY